MQNDNMNTTDGSALTATEFMEQLQEKDVCDCDQRCPRCGRLRRFHPWYPYYPTYPWTYTCQGPEPEVFFSGQKLV